MERERKAKLMWRWSFFSAGLIALFWVSWYLATGSVPMIKSIMTSNWTLELPFGISRWWDILIGPICSVIIISFFTSEKIRKNKDLDFGLVYILFLCTVFGLVLDTAFGTIYGPVFGLSYGLAFGSVFCLVFGLFYGLGYGLGYGLAFGSVYGSVYGLVYGLVFYLVYGLVFYLVYGLVFCLVALLRIASQKSFWSRINSWLLAKET